MDVRDAATFFTVAPSVGAWIETLSHEGVKGILSVAPSVGAWIETLVSPGEG